MIPAPGPNFALNSMGIPNIANYFCCGSNEQNMATLRLSTVDTGSIAGVVSGTHSGMMQPMQGSSKYFIQGMPATRLGDMAMTNNNNMVTTQIVPSQGKYFINV